MHVAVFAARHGIDAERIAGTVQWRADDPRWADDERAIVALVDALHERARVDDSTWRALGDVFDEAQLVELVVLVGFYHTISFVTNAFEIALEPEAARFPKERP